MDSCTTAVKRSYSYVLEGTGIIEAHNGGSVSGTTINGGGTQGVEASSFVALSDGHGGTNVSETPATNQTVL
jgi:autotransporter passenger strand-loop-strand repeat protein